MRILAKVIKNNKIKKDYIYQLENDFTIHDFFEYMSDICSELDLPVPIVMTKHIKNFILFDSTTFTQEDFVETLGYDKLVLEIVKS